MALTKIGKEGITGISNASNATAITIDASENVGIGTGSPGSKLSVESGANANANSEALTFLSSVINTQDNPILTTSIDYANYVGNLTIQGSTLVDADYYDINSYRYGNAANGNSESRTIGYTINGYHPYIRLKFEANVGNIVTILAR